MTYYHLCAYEEVTHSGLSILGTLELEGAEFPFREAISSVHVVSEANRDSQCLFWARRMEVRRYHFVFLLTQIIWELLNLLHFEAALMAAPRCAHGRWGHTLCVVSMSVRNGASSTVVQILAEALSVLF